MNRYQSFLNHPIFNGHPEHKKVLRLTSGIQRMVSALFFE
jgi:hypothetical protein